MQYEFWLGPRPSPAKIAAIKELVDTALRELEARLNNEAANYPLAYGRQDDDETRRSVAIGGDNPKEGR